MGPFKWFANMECAHSVLSKRHRLQGRLEINGSALICLFGPAPIGQDFVYTTGRKCLTRFFEPWATKETREK